MTLILIILIGLVIFDMAAWYWGADSTEAFDSPEWKRRKHWRGVGNNGGCE